MTSPAATPAQAAPGNTVHRAHRALTDDELSVVFDRIDAATSTTDLLTRLLACVFDALLADVDETRDDYGPDRLLDPTTLAIPTTQWKAVTGAAIRRAAAWGTGAQLAMELVNLMPSSYPDPDVYPGLDVPAPQPPPDQRRDYRPEVTHLHVSRHATDTITAIEAHLAALAGYYGPDSDQYRHAEVSWHRQLAALFTSALGPVVTVGRDGPLSLLVTGGGLTFGILFHGQPRTCTVTGCHARTSSEPAAVGDGEPWRPAYHGAPVLDHAHVPPYPLDAPQPGTWSVHS